MPDHHHAALYAELCARPWAMYWADLEALRHYALSGETPTGRALMLTLTDDDSDDETTPRMTVIDGIAIIGIEGIILKEVPAIWRYFGFAATSTTEVEAMLAAAVEEPGIRAILLAVDSPGGEVPGIQELGDAIYAARAVKPVHAAIEDLGASGAYWLASQAQTVAANRTAAVGSIGVYTVLDDSSKYWEEQGLKAHLIASGPYKGVGELGVPIKPEQLTPIQEEIDGLAGIFVEAVARGRGFEVARVAEWATGRSWLAEPAHALGLIDRVEGAAATFERVASQTNRRTTTFLKELPMSLLAAIKTAIGRGDTAVEQAAVEQAAVEQAAVEQPDTEQAAVDQSDTEQTAVEQPETPPPVAATISPDELATRVAAFGAEFAVASIEHGQSLEDALIDHHALQADRIEELQTHVTELEQEIADLKAAHAAEMDRLGVRGEDEAAEHSEHDPEGEAIAADAKEYTGVLTPGQATAAATLKQQLHGQRS